MNLTLDPRLFVVVVRHVELGEAGLALAILDEDEADHAWPDQWR